MNTCFAFILKVNEVKKNTKPFNESHLTLKWKWIISRGQGLTLHSSNLPTRNQRSPYLVCSNRPNPKPSVHRHATRTIPISFVPLAESQNYHRDDFPPRTVPPTATSAPIQNRNRNYKCPRATAIKRSCHKHALPAIIRNYTKTVFWLSKSALGDSAPLFISHCVYLHRLKLDGDDYRRMRL